MLGLARDYLSVHLYFYFPSLLLVVGNVPTGEARFALSVLEEDKPNLSSSFRDKLLTISFNISKV